MIYTSENLKLNEKSNYFDNFSNIKKLQDIENRYKCNIFAIQPNKNIFDMIKKESSNNLNINCFHYDELDANFKNLNEIIFENQITDIDILNLRLDSSGCQILDILCDTEYISIIENIVIHNMANYNIPRSLKNSLFYKLKKSHKKVASIKLNTQRWIKI